MSRFAYRSLLFVPPADNRKLACAAASDAEALILDWEDGTAQHDKAHARQETMSYCAAPGAARKPVFVRINPLHSREYAHDREALRHILPEGIILPKCSSIDPLHLLTSFLEQVHPGRCCMLMPLIETASGLLLSAAIAAYSPRIAAIGFGAEDFTADTEIRPGPEGFELLHARSCIVTAARAAGVEPVDSPCLHYRDLSMVEQSARRSRRLGFASAMAIHPAQIPVIHQAFAPSSIEIEQARTIIKTMKSQASGAVGYEGVLLDEPVLLRARRLLARAGLAE